MKKLKMGLKSSFVVYILLTSFSLNLKAQKPLFEANTTIYVVRHAEKDTGKNPTLTTAGFARAGDLMHKLNNKGIQTIFSTDTRRTLQTADSIKLLYNIPLIKYLGDTIGNDLVNKINQNHSNGKTILVVGHSNTVPKLIRRLGVKKYTIENLGDNEFDNLFVLTYKKSKIKFKKIKYGQPSALFAKMN
jgi:broad specificity phosphatase PhoE